MSLKGKWRIVEMEAWDKDFLDLVEPAYILIGETSSEFAFGCITGSFSGVGDSNAIAFDWDGADEMDEARGDPSSWSSAHPFIARRWESSSTAC